MNDHVLQALTMGYLIVGTTATGITAVCTNSWLPMLIGYPLTLAGTAVLFLLTKRAIDRS